jgi:hypothetical protein
MGATTARSVCMTRAVNRRRLVNHFPSHTAVGEMFADTGNTSTAKRVIWYFCDGALWRCVGGATQCLSLKKMIYGVTFPREATGRDISRSLNSSSFPGPTIWTLLSYILTADISITALASVVTLFFFAFHSASLGSEQVRPFLRQRL